MKSHLFRWHRRTQLDIEWRSGWLSLGWTWVRRQEWRRSPWLWRPIAYWSPDATPVHPGARGWGHVG